MKNLTQNLPLFEEAEFRLRPVAKGDETAIYDFNSKLEHLEYIARTPYKKMKQAEDHLDRYLRGLETGTMAWWCIEDVASGDGIGYIGFFGVDPDGHSAELGYGVVKSHWGKGIVSKAVSRIVEFGQSQMRIHRIHAMVDERNDASIRILEKNGFNREGLMRDVEFARKMYFNMYMFSLINEV